MTNEEFQKIMLKEFKGLNQRFDNLETDVKDLKTEVNGLNQRFDSLQTRVGIIESQTSENTQILKALLHSSEVNKAEHDKMILGITHIEEDVSAVRKDLSMVETITANNYSDIARLKAIR